MAVLLKSEVVGLHRNTNGEARGSAKYQLSCILRLATAGLCTSAASRILQGCIVAVAAAASLLIEALWGRAAARCRVRDDLGMSTTSRACHDPVHVRH